LIDHSATILGADGGRLLVIDTTPDFNSVSVPEVVER
jgi:hypothetical protein